MQPDEILHEREINFFNQGGHHHDGIDSTLVQIDLANLANEVAAIIGGSTGSSSNSQLTQLVPLDFDTAIIPAGGSQTGQLQWSNFTLVVFTRIVMSINTTCSLTFYHLPTFADQDREFRAENCTNMFLWEGVWAHSDESSTGHIYWKITNTGSADSSFRIQLKSGVAVAATSLPTSTVNTTNTVEGMTFSMPGTPLVIDHSTRYYPFHNVATVTVIASLDTAGTSSTVINLIKNGSTVQQVTINSGQNLLTQQFSISLAAATDYFMTSIASIGTGAGYLSLQIQFS